MSKTRPSTPLTSPTRSAIPPRRPCVGCYEVIDAAAMICPHCGTQQMTSRWSTLGSALRWTGVAITSISLFMGALTLSGLYSDWRQRHDTVAELVEAAHMLNGAGSHAQAWAMYEDALELSPAAAEARQGQVITAMAWLRNARIRGDERFAGVVDPLVPVLYRGLVDADDEAAADILAHLGWGQYLKARDRDRDGYRDAFVAGRPDRLFERALEKQPDNLRAHEMWGFWLTLTGAPFEEPRKHFETALSVARREHDDERFASVRRRQVNAAKFVAARPSGITAERRSAAGDELLRIANEMRLGEEPHPDEDTRYYMFKHYGYRDQASNVEHVIALLPADEHLATFRWLFDEMYPADTDRSMGNTRADQRRYVIARLTEASGDGARALELYRELAELENLREELRARCQQRCELIAGESDLCMDLRPRSSS